MAKEEALARARSEAEAKVKAVEERCRKDVQGLMDLHERQIAAKEAIVEAERGLLGRHRETAESLSALASKVEASSAAAVELQGRLLSERERAVIVRVERLGASERALQAREAVRALIFSDSRSLPHLPFKCISLSPSHHGARSEFSDAKPLLPPSLPLPLSAGHRRPGTGGGPAARGARRPGGQRRLLRAGLPAAGLRRTVRGGAGTTTLPSGVARPSPPLRGLVAAPCGRSAISYTHPSDLQPRRARLEREQARLESLAQLLTADREAARTALEQERVQIAQERKARGEAGGGWGKRERRGVGICLRAFFQPGPALDVFGIAVPDCRLRPRLWRRSARRWRS